MTDAGSGANSVGDKVRALREQLGWSQTELGQRSGIEQTLISRLERGKMPNPSHRMLSSLAQALGASVATLTVHGSSVRGVMVDTSVLTAPSPLEAAVLRVPDLAKYDLRAFDAARAAARAAGDMFAGHDEAAVAARLLRAAQELLGSGRELSPLLVFARALAEEVRGAPADAPTARGGRR